jgi:hypothetical protein
MEAMAQRLRERGRDSEAPDEYLRYVEYFRVITLG